MAKQTASAHKHQRWFTEAEAAEYLGVSSRWMKRARLEGRIPYSKRGKFVRYERGDLDAVIEAQRVPAFRPLTPAHAMEAERALQSIRTQRAAN